MEVTERDLFKVLERHGITRFDPLGEKFDPHQHEAMVKVDVPGVPADIVVQVLHAGYKIADRILRPAAVIVAKGGTPARPEPIHTESQQDHARANPPPGGDDGDASARARTSSMHINVMGAESNDPDVVRGPRGAPRGANNNNNAQSRNRDRPWAEKRGSTMTRPISEDSGPLKKDDLMSSFGKRPDKD